MAFKHQKGRTFVKHRKKASRVSLSRTTVIFHYLGQNKASGNKSDKTLDKDSPEWFRTHIPLTLDAGEKLNEES